MADWMNPSQPPPPAAKPQRKRSGQPDPSHRIVRIYLGLALLLTLLCLVYWGYILRDQLFCWEGHVARQIADRIAVPGGWWGLWSDCLLWGPHLVSLSENSLFYAPLAAVSTTFLGINPWSIRLPSMLWLLATQVLLFQFVRRSQSSVAALGACFFVALSPFALLPGVMGFSVAASRFAALGAVAATVWLLSTSRPRPHDGILAGLALYLATVQYTPARLLVVVCLWIALPTLAIRARHLRKLDLLRLGGLLMVVALVVGVQTRRDRLSAYFDGGGETLFQLTLNPTHMRDTIGVDISGREPTWAEVGRAAWSQVRKNLPELIFYLNPDPRRLPVDETVVTSPPHIRMVLLWFVPFVLLGLVRAIRRCWEPCHAILLIYAVGVIPVALTCSFLRAFRIDLLALPAAVWCGLGIDWAVTRMRGLAPVWLLHVSAVTAVVAGSWYTAHYLGWPGDHSEQQEATRFLALQARSARTDTVISAVLGDEFLTYLALIGLDRRDERPAVIVDFMRLEELATGGLDRLLAAYPDRPRRPVKVWLVPPGPDSLVSDELLTRLGGRQQLTTAGPRPCRVVELDWPQ
jgi:hypothetical protein